MISSRTRFLIEKIRDRFFFKKKGSVIVVCWSMSHNPVGRAFLFADFLRRDYKTSIIGPTFNKFGKKIWLPLRSYLKGAETFTASLNLEEFIQQAEEFALKQPEADIVIICKPRLPSILLGLLIALKNNAKVILDIDDYELAFFDNPKPLTIDEAIEQGLDLSNPYHETWTRVCDSLIDQFPNKIVSNHKLQEKFGGVIIPHVRNERIFNPTLYNRKKIRAKHGYTEKDKVILFLGTPREHKGFEEIPKALKEIGNPNYKFCLIGKIRSDSLRKRFMNEWGDFAQVFNDSDFRDLPEKLMLADLICLIQDEHSLVTEYQLPAKLMDAVSMGIPVLSTSVGPLKRFSEDEILIRLMELEGLTDRVKEVLDNIEAFKKAAQKNRKAHFHSEFSYQFGLNECENLLRNAIESQPSLVLNSLEKIVTKGKKEA